MKPAQAAKSAAKIGWDSLEDLGKKFGNETINPMLAEMAHEFGFGAGISHRPQSLAQEDLARARQEEEIKKKDQEDNKKSNAAIAAIRDEYRIQETRSEKNQQPLKQEVAELQSEIAKLAKAAGIDTKAHLEAMPKKVGILDIKRLTTIVHSLRLKADEAKSANELVAQRSNAKRTTGMLAWVSGKQMKVHEQGTLQLQG